MGRPYVAIIVSLMLAGVCITATVAENCRIKNKTGCSNNSTIALTVFLSLALAFTGMYWVKPIYFPPGGLF